MSRYLIIVPSFATKEVAPEQVHSFIVHCRDFRRWWSNIPLVWIVETDLTAQQAATILRSTMNGINFIVSEIDPSKTDGWLPVYAWDWFYPHEVPKLLEGPKTSPLSLLGLPPRP